MRRPALVAAAALAVALVVVFALRLTSSPPDRTKAAPAGQDRPTTTAAAGNAAPTADEHSEAGAVAAAVAMATASQDLLYRSDDEIAAAVRASATAQAGDALAAEAVADLGAARQGLAASAGRVWWLVRPLATNVERYDPGAARVVVWTLTVLSATEVALPQADWLRVAVDLEWEDGAWRARAVTDTPGPTPMTGAKDRPWEAVAFDQALDGFERVGASPPRP